MREIKDNLSLLFREHLKTRDFKLTVPGLPRDAKALLTASLASETGLPLIFVTSDYREINAHIDNLRHFTKAFGYQSRVLSFPDCQVYPYDEASVYRDITFERTARSLAHVEPIAHSPALVAP